MKEYQHKYIVRRLLYSRITIVVLFLAIVLLLRSVMELNDKRIETHKLETESAVERKDLEQKVAKAEQKNADINTPRGFEAYVRITFPVVQEGEGVIVVYDDEKSSVADVRSDVSMWERLLIWWRGVKESK